MCFHRNERVNKFQLNTYRCEAPTKISFAKLIGIGSNVRMSFRQWIEYIKNAEKASFISGKLRRIHYNFKDGAEMIEEYSMDTGILVKRAWKKKRDVLCTETADDMNSTHFNWDIELGEKIEPMKNSEFLVKESLAEPILTKRITRINIEWRIRNLPYPLDTYAVTVDANKKSIIVRTTNKKYYKEIHMPELTRCNIVPEQDQLKLMHQHNTLIITYKKPELVAQMERETLRILQHVETEADDDIDNELMKRLLGTVGDAPNS